MPDRFDAATRSRIMSHVRGKHTGPELALRKALRLAGVSYRIHPKDVPGRPDVAHKGSRVAVFVDGCFWHGCPKHYKVPKSRIEFWSRKLAYVKDLRVRTLDSLAEGGWNVIEFWECDVRTDATSAALRVKEAIESKRGRKEPVTGPKARTPPTRRAPVARGPRTRATRPGRS
ncbi:MAG: very short patch repair endonuclease [Thermoplasmatota archaeon]